MRIAVICAMDIEAKSLIDLLDQKEIVKILDKTFYYGKIKNEDVAVAVSGIGKVASGITTTLLIEHFKPDVVINSGIAGGYNKVKTLDLVIASDVAYYDVDLTADNQEFGALQGLPKYFPASKEMLEKASKNVKNYCLGTIITADVFASDRNKIDNIVKKYYHDNVLAVDMESASVAHACYLTNTPFMIMRVISDVIGEESQITSYYEFSTAACNASVEAIINLIN
jgi:adenosylhomocysteine nucleosidase